MEFLQHASLYLITAVIAVPVAQRLGLGSVLGYLLAGILLGPVTGFVGAESQDIMHFAEFGVVMMLFLVGLELQPKILWNMRGKLVGLGGLQVLLTAGLLAGGALALGLSLRVSVATGVIVSLSSTAIVLKTLNENRLMPTPGGQASFSVLLAQDIAVIPILALLPLLALPSSGEQLVDDHASTNLIAGFPAAVQSAIVLAVVVAIIGGGHYLVRPAFRFIATARLREIFTAAALGLVVVIALIMTSIGVSPALGTFVAGVVLSGNEYRHELESDIEPFKGLLLGLFFISVGASIDFELLFAEGGLIAGLTLAVMAGKALVLLVLGQVFGLRGPDRLLFTLGLAQAGEFGFVLSGVARSSDIVSELLAARINLVVALSMLSTPLLFMLFHAITSRKGAQAAPVREADVVDEQGLVVMAGIGRFGQIISRLLQGSDFRVVVLDHDHELVDMLRKAGQKAYYGDATRTDLLMAAGIEHARVFVAAMDDRRRQTELVAHVAKHHPNCHIIARAINRHHVYELEQAGAHEVVREMFESSLEAGRRALEALGIHPFSAERKICAFRSHDLQGLRKLEAAWRHAGADHNYLNQARIHAQALRRVLASEAQARHDDSARGWTPPPRGKVAPRPEPESAGDPQGERD